VLLVVLLLLLLLLVVVVVLLLLWLLLLCLANEKRFHPRAGHLGACDNRYEPTYRGFDSFMGYLAGGEGYYNHASDFRNGSTPGEC
jgi:hypothetical protein